jgi:hypothetical protein
MIRKSEDLPESEAEFPRSGRSLSRRDKYGSPYLVARYGGFFMLRCLR